jgi:hypothetical protein
MTTAVLVDTSRSMATCDIVGSEQSRIDVLRSILDEVLRTVADVRVIAFDNEVRELPGLEPGRQLCLPPPRGGTCMDLAFAYIVEHGPKPAKVVLITDGLPSCEPSDVFQAARRLAPIQINCLYCGPDGPAGREPLAFLRALSLIGGRRGVSGRRSLDQPKALASEIAGLIGSPPR